MVVPKRDHTVKPKPIRTAAAMNVPMAPRLLSHFPTPSPTMFTNSQQYQQRHGSGHCESLIVCEPACPRPSQTRTRRRNTTSPSAHTACYWSSNTNPREIRESRRILPSPTNIRRLHRVTMREFDHRNPLRPEEQKQRDDPQPDGHAPVGSDARNNVEIEYGNYKQQHQSRRPRTRFKCG